MSLETLAGARPEWHDRAACRDVADPDIFFPERGGSSRAARSLCSGCPVLDECLAWTLEIEPEFGIYANTSPRERRVLKRGRGVLVGVEGKK